MSCHSLFGAKKSFLTLKLRWHGWAVGATGIQVVAKLGRMGCGKTNHRNGVGQYTLVAQ